MVHGFNIIFIIVYCFSIHMSSNSMIGLLFAFFALTRQANTPTASHTPYATSSSGVPSPLAVCLTCGIGLLLIFLIVVVLCIKKSTDNEAFGSTQALLMSPDV